MVALGVWGAEEGGGAGRSREMETEMSVDPEHLFLSDQT